jgi:hypothetical protein
VRRPGRAVAALVVLAATVSAVGACGPAPSTSPAGASPTSVSPSPAASALSSSPSAGTGAAVEVDPSLLDVLPAAIDGQPLRPDAETAAEIAANQDLALDIEAIAVGLYVAPGASTADDFAVVNVVRVRPDVFDEAWFRSWRSTYDEGACQVAGGVAPGAAVTRIGEHDTHIGSCQAGVHTYHVHLPSPDRVVSITAAGDVRFGERVVAGLTE